VLASGAVVTASDDGDADLYWALRGGGGNFGVVTSFEYRLHALASVLGGVVLHPLAAAPELYEPILAALVESGTALEINTSGLRSPAEEAFPSPAIVARFHAMGGRAVTIGSDAHTTDSFAWALADGYVSAADAGFSAMAFRRGGERVEIELSKVPNATAGRSL